MNVKIIILNHIKPFYNNIHEHNYYKKHKVNKYNKDLM
jgi:hypothetical protein